MPIRFGKFELDEEQFILQRAGEGISLRPKVFDLLLYLVRHRERVVPRQELTRALWSDTAVGCGSLSGLVNELRNDLGEVRGGVSSIRTVHARGYQFVAAIRDEVGREEGGGLRADLRIDFGIRSRHAAVLDRLQRAILTTWQHSALGFLIEGAPRCGKSALLEEAVQFAGRHDIEVLRLGLAEAGPRKRPGSTVDSRSSTRATPWA